MASRSVALIGARLLTAGLVATIGLQALAMARAPAAAAATPYTMATQASYLVTPESGDVAIAVAVTFTNTTPDPPGRYSQFTAVPIAIHGGARDVTARDATGTLTVSVSGASPTIAAVHLRSALRYGKAASFTLAYHLADGASPDVRVRASAIVLPVWGFGTSAEVTVRLPSAYEVGARGAAMTSTTAGGQTTLASGPINDPGSWLALVTASRATDLRTVRRSVALRGGTVDLQVRSWSDDTAWGAATLELLAAGLPALQDQIGLPYAGVGPVVVTEALPVGTGAIVESASGAQEIAIAFDATPFTILHQAAHLWLGSSLLADRWIREGLASEVAGRVAQAMGDALPYDPAVAAQARAADAFPLATWTSGSAAGPVTPAAVAREGYGYAASWEVMRQILAVVGLEGMRTVLARAAGGIGAYEPPSAPGGAPAASLAPAVPLDTRRLLDQLEQVSGRDLTGLFGERVLPPVDDDELVARSTARSAYARLATTAGDWGVPDAVRGAMSRWEFDTASQLIGAALDWLGARDTLVAAARGAGLAIPARLTDAWRASGGEAPARAELAAEQAVVTAYRSADAEIAGNPNPIERLGLLGAPSPRELLARAAGLYSAGDLDAAAAGIADAVRADHDAQPSGVVRLAAAAAVLAVLVAGAVLLLRRLRAPSD